MIATRLSFGLSSALRQVVNIPIYTACRALKTDPYPVQFGVILFFEALTGDHSPLNHVRPEIGKLVRDQSARKM
jgi:hypothetical protein